MAKEPCASDLTSIGKLSNRPGTSVVLHEALAQMLRSQPPCERSLADHFLDSVRGKSPQQHQHAAVLAFFGLRNVRFPRIYQPKTAQSIKTAPDPFVLNKDNIYQVRVITCAENDAIVLPALLYGTAHVALAAADDLSRVANALHRRFPDLHITVRADAGFAVPEMYQVLDSLHNVTWSIGYQMNTLMQQKCEELMGLTLETFEQTGQTTKNFMHLKHQSRNWSREHDLVIKCEANEQGTNRRVIISNRPGVEHYPDGTYQEYADRGESENRNKELTVDLCTDRLSDHRYMANLFRVMIHCVSCNLLSRLRGITQEVSADEMVVDGLHDEEGLPLEARSEGCKRTARNRRRHRDPLGRGRAMTWRTMIIKVAARIATTTRQLRLLIPSGWPHWRHLVKVSQSLAAYSPSG